MNKKALIAMSGGVDSSVAAHIMKTSGYDISGAIMRLYEDEQTNFSQNINDAKSVCEKLNVPFHIFDMRRIFQKNVIESFVSQYRNGHTPNPCVTCNKLMKFKAFIREAKTLGIGTIATGHYARIEKAGDRYLLKKGRDANKDQSYFLYHLTQEQLSQTVFPLGDMLKDEIREIAFQNGFVNAEKKDSQDICFVPCGDYVKVIKEYSDPDFSNGSFVNTKGEIIGTHPGHIHYTIGQRKGLGTGFGERVYVLGKDPLENKVILGKNEELFSDTLTASDFNWIALQNPSGTIRAEAKIRYGAKEAPANVHILEDGRVEIVFDEPQRAIASGQAVVLYEGDTVIGGGTIE